MMVDYDRTLGFLGSVNSVNNSTTAATAFMSHHRASPHLAHLDHHPHPHLHPSSSSASSAPTNTTTTTTTPSSTVYPPFVAPPHHPHRPHRAAIMSQGPPPNSSQSRSQGQPTSYPSPRSYPSPSMSAYAYPPPQQQQTVEPYRASPTGSHVSLPNLNLPPLRAIDPRHPPQAQAHAPHAPPPHHHPPPTPSAQSAQPQPPSMGSPLPPPVAPMGYYHNQPPSAMPSHHHQQSPHPGMTNSPHHQPLRYPLPATDGRILSGGRHKKEIKRRTKTGCLTCRKRRIKCDEAHPMCRNCQKSKRECLGYDPIFKAQLSPAAIQPAPSSAPSLSSTPGTAPAPGSAVPYPSGLQHGYGNPVAGQFAAALSAGGSSPGSSVEPYDYSAAIDPALEAAGPAPMGAPSSGLGGAYEGTPGFRPDLKRGLGSASPYSSAASDTQTSRGGANPIPASASASAGTATSNGRGVHHRSGVAHTSFPAKPIKIDDLLRLGGGLPPPLTTPPTTTTTEHTAPSIPPPMLDQIKHVYLTIYAHAIDQFLETTWFHTRGLPTLLGDGKLCEIFASLIERFADQHTTGEALAVTQNLEARVVWMLMCLCRSAAAFPPTEPTNGVDTSTSTTGDDRDMSSKSLDEALRRLRVLENLLTGTVLDTNPADLSRISSVLRSDQGKFRELEFWRLVGKFLTLRDNEASSAREIDDTLTGCRSLLDNHENRDIIYSAAVVRHVGGRVAEFPSATSNNPGQSGSANLFEATGAAAAAAADEKDNNNKLHIAKTFIETEAGGAATTTVLARLCDLIIRSWGVVSTGGATSAPGAGAGAGAGAAPASH